jgi:hypothetical protein
MSQPERRAARALFSIAYRMPAALPMQKTCCRRRSFTSRDPHIVSYNLDGEPYSALVRMCEKG